MDTNNTNIISIKITELLQKRLRFIAVMQQICGVISIISGALTCLGIITAIFGVPLLIAGIKLFQSGSAFSLTANTKRGEDLLNAITNLHSYWKLLLITIIAIVLTYVLLFVGMLVLIPMLGSRY